MKSLHNFCLLFFSTSLILFGCIPRAPQLATPESTVNPIAKPTETAAPKALLSPNVVPEGWNSYINEELGLSFSYPDTYSVLTDEENLYGWENGILLLYDGGQSYDIVVQVWESAEEMEANFGTRVTDVTVFEMAHQFISVFDITMEENNSAIIATFETAK